MEFGHYSVRQTGSKTDIDYTRTPGDWAAIGFSLVVGLAACAFIWLLYVHTRFDKPIFWVVGLLAAFIACLTLTGCILRLLHPARSVVSIAKDTKEVTIRYTAFKRRVVPFNEIRSLLLKGKDIATKYKLSLQHSTYITLEILTKTGGSIAVLTINPDQVIAASQAAVEETEYSTGHGLAAFLAGELGVSYTWTGFERTYA